MSNEETVFDEEREIAEAVECLMDELADYEEPTCPNHADELTDEAFIKAGEALIVPFSKVAERYYASRRGN